MTDLVTSSPTALGADRADQQSGDSPRAPRNKARVVFEQRAGETLPGGLVLKRLIDVGGMAGIFEASGPDGPVAIKLMRLDVNHQDILRDRFPLEREISRRVNHENCLQILDQGVCAG